MENTNENVGTTANEQVTTTEANELVSMSKLEYEKVLQSSEDKLRTKYSKIIKELEGKIGELTPATKSDSEIELAIRLKMIEEKQKEVEAKEQYLDFQTALHSKNIDSSIAGFLKQDIDLDKFEATILNIVNDRVKKSGYVPTSHETNTGISKKEWDKMSYTDKQRIFDSNPELATKLMKTK